MDKQIILGLKAQAFDKQREVIRCKAKRIALHVGRRGAKTSVIVLLYIMYALMHENIRLVFIGLSGENAENAFLPHAKKFMNKVGLEEGIDYTYNKTERLFEFKETHSTISLKGWDTSYKEMGKILGGQCFSVCLDEMQNQSQDTEKAIEHYIGPAVSDYIPVGGGTIYCLGTSGDFMGDNFWYRICTTKEGELDKKDRPQKAHMGWTYFTWLDKENPHMLEAKLMEDEEFLERHGPGFEQLDFYQQQYLNKWITDGQRRVYLLKDHNLMGNELCQTGTPNAAFLHNATYVLGMDFGFYPDPMAFVIGCYNLKYSNKLFIIDCFQQTNMLIGAIHLKLLELKKLYRFSTIVADAGAQAKSHVADLNETYKHNIVAADKLGKFAHQNMINSDFLTEDIIIAPKCQDLISELQNLIWDPIKLNKGKRVEKDSLPNNLCDALLYMHHFSRHQWYRVPIQQATPEEHFTNSILRAEQQYSRTDFTNQNKQRFNPYGHKTNYR